MCLVLLNVIQVEVAHGFGNKEDLCLYLSIDNDINSEKFYLESFAKMKIEAIAKVDEITKEHVYNNRNIKDPLFTNYYFRTFNNVLDSLYFAFKKYTEINDVYLYFIAINIIKNEITLYYRNYK